MQRTGCACDGISLLVRLGSLLIAFGVLSSLLVGGLEQRQHSAEGYPKEGNILCDVELASNDFVPCRALQSIFPRSESLPFFLKGTLPSPNGVVYLSSDERTALLFREDVRARAENQTVRDEERESAQGQNAQDGTQEETDGSTGVDGPEFVFPGAWVLLDKVKREVIGIFQTVDAEDAVIPPSFLPLQVSDGACEGPYEANKGASGWKKTLPLSVQCRVGPQPSHAEFGFEGSPCTLLGDCGEDDGSDPFDPLVCARLHPLHSQCMKESEAKEKGLTVTKGPQPAAPYGNCFFSKRCLVEGTQCFSNRRFEDFAWCVYPEVCPRETGTSLLRASESHGYDFPGRRLSELPEEWGQGGWGSTKASVEISLYDTQKRLREMQKKMDEEAKGRAERRRLFSECVKTAREGGKERENLGTSFEEGGWDWGDSSGLLLEKEGFVSPSPAEMQEAGDAGASTGSLDDGGVSRCTEGLLESFDFDLEDPNLQGSGSGGGDGFRFADMDSETLAVEVDRWLVKEWHDMGGSEGWECGRPLGPVAEKGNGEGDEVLGREEYRRVCRDFGLESLACLPLDTKERAHLREWRRRRRRRLGEVEEEEAGPLEREGEREEERLMLGEFVRNLAERAEKEASEAVDNEGDEEGGVLESMSRRVLLDIEFNFTAFDADGGSLPFTNSSANASGLPLSPPAEGTARMPEAALVQVCPGTPVVGKAPSRSFAPQIICGPTFAFAPALDLGGSFIFCPNVATAPGIVLGPFIIAGVFFAHAPAVFSGFSLSLAPAAVLGPLTSFGYYMNLAPGWYLLPVASASPASTILAPLVLGPNIFADWVLDRADTNTSKVPPVEGPRVEPKEGVVDLAAVRTFVYEDVFPIDEVAATVRLLELPSLPLSEKKAGALGLRRSTILGDYVLTAVFFDFTCPRRILRRLDDRPLPQYAQDGTHVRVFWYEPFDSFSFEFSECVWPSLADVVADIPTASVKPLDWVVKAAAAKVAAVERRIPASFRAGLQFALSVVEVVGRGRIPDFVSLVRDDIKAKSEEGGVEGGVSKGGEGESRLRGGGGEGGDKDPPGLLEGEGGAPGVRETVPSLSPLQGIGLGWRKTFESLEREETYGGEEDGGVHGGSLKLEGYFRSFVEGKASPAQDGVQDSENSETMDSSLMSRRKCPSPPGNTAFRTPAGDCLRPDPPEFVSRQETGFGSESFREGSSSMLRDIISTTSIFTQEPLPFLAADKAESGGGTVSEK
uniref:Uncharacterized protein n=1 Tax=Chromera velia CCMP2878 TaxID=1169474 RepID=A0A0G4HE68_9ALVE|eukprot:Cvel_26669.t1-p1 / transcript=Cvel_26669.t1 / gene=Cvel_26669 / organism=Chromera_velia_CCMP2878 / gene_product=Collagen alpha-1(I) chain, putative / transcript_product=Collagen alpha-1(I) chain, putative / location=Cvel_scaffold3209:6414-11097(+) / protein_length=1236 / sequence_SO=supercontig / SO=protein_coding / is_pseudo=false